MQITSKGQVTIPQAIREAAGFLPYTEVEFSLQRGVVTLKKARRKKSGKKLSRGELLIKHMTGRGDVGLTTDQIMALTRGE